MKSTRRRWAGLLTAGALGLTLVACSGDDPTTETSSAATSDTEQTSASTEAAADTAGASETSGDAAPAEGEEVDLEEFMALLKSPGEEKLSSYTLEMAMTMGSQEMNMSGKADLSSGAPAFDMEMTLPGMGDVHMIMADGKVYMAMPGVTEEGKFMEVPKEQLGETADQLDEIDITSTWDAWEGSDPQVVYLGEEDVDGQQMRHYEVTVDSAAALDAAGETGEDAAAASALMGDEVTYEVWLDDENLMRKIAFDVQGVVSEIRTADWGEPMDIQAPTADQLQSLPATGSDG